MNKNLPNDIAVFDILLVENHQHARYSAVQRQYNYYFHCTKNPYLSQYSTELTLKIVHLKEMAAAIQLLNVHSNYIAFCVQPELYEHTLCKVNNAQLWYNTESEQYCFQVSSNRFLRKMIRILMHHFIQIGAGKMQLEDFEKLLACMQPQTNVFPFVQQGLFLSKIDYPFLNLANKTAYFISNKQKKNLNWIRL